MDIPASLEAMIIKDYHVIEKGLAMPNFRYRFGIGNISGLVGLMERYRAAGGPPANIHYSSAVLCLKAYISRHETADVDISDIITRTVLKELMTGIEEMPDSITGGVNEISSMNLFAETNSSFEKFAASRKSCRNFDPSKIVDCKTIESAVQIARSAPSVCNRQSWRVHSYFDRDQIDQLLSYQNGNVGFGHRINCLLVVTVNLECFDGPIERYQFWIDGGMFGMMLLLALHHLQVGAVALNWSAMPENDRNLRSAGKIPLAESVVMLIGVGHPVENLLIPNSQRRSLSEIYSDHSDPQKNIN